MYNPDDLQKDIGIYALLGGGLVLSAAVWLASVVFVNRQEAESQQNYMRLREQVWRKADTDNDGKISAEELQAVYKKLGIDYDASKPKELTTSDLEKFLKG
jgi:hypothetical protein